MDIFNTELKLTNHKKDLFDVFKKHEYLIDHYYHDSVVSPVDVFRLFSNYFNAVPHTIVLFKVDDKKAINYMLTNYKNDIKDNILSQKNYFKDSQKHIDLGMILWLFDDLMIEISTARNITFLLYRNTPVEKVKLIYDALSNLEYKRPSNLKQISLLVEESFGMEIRPMNIAKHKINIEQNYNTDFEQVHKNIMKRLSKNNDNGIILLHGKPGTGKTSYIRHIINSVEKPVIFLPPNMAPKITDPNLITLLIDNPNSIFVIEDAENIVVNRDNTDHSPVSALLNIADGLLSDCLNIQIICSFNTDISKIDNALLRKGRLIARYEFKELSADKAQNLSNKLGFGSTIKEPMLLADIYNQNEQDYANQKTKQIGFTA